MAKTLVALAASGFGGIPQPSLAAGLERGPDYIGLDMGTVDLGAHYLGAGTVAGATDQDLELLLQSRAQAGIPLLAGSAGIAGADHHVNQVYGRLRTIADNHGQHCRIARIYTELQPETVHLHLDAGRVHPLWPGSDLTHDDIDACARIVGQVGPEAYLDALEQGADIVLGGRACDASPFVALPLHRGLDPGLSYHLAKIMECVSLCAEPGGRDCLLGTLDGDGFTVESMNPLRRCTPVSVAAHSLYEQSDPFTMVEPGGQLDLRGCTYQAVSDRVTRVTGSLWTPSTTYSLKMEGAAASGFRSFAMGGIRDPYVITNLDIIEKSVRASVELGYGTAGYRLRFRRYGIDGVLGSNEPDRTPPKEVFLLIDVLAPDQTMAHAICANAKQNAMHCGFDGRRSTAGNLAYPFSPEVWDGGELFDFRIYHVVDPIDPRDCYRLEITDV